MACEQFVEKKFKPASLELIAACNQIIERYQAQNLRLTLRQLYYQLVTRNLIPNVERSYKNLSGLVTDARMAGVLDWDAIEDRVRQPRIPQEFDDLADLVRAAVQSYRLDRWAGQEYYAELWVEKDALAGVLRPLASEFHVTLMVNRGYSSASAMYESAARFNVHPEPKQLYYLGDFDPSGEDMVRDIRDRLGLFGVEELTVNKIALTWAQIQEYNLPPNPAKVSDPRAAGYIARHGDSSWEVDALPPEVLAATVREAFAEILDLDLMNAVKEREARDKKRLQAAAKELSK